MQTIVFQLLVQIILILINAFFAATEIAVISLNANKLRKLEEEGDKLAPKLLHMVEDSSGFLSTIQIAITLSGFLGAAFAGDAFAEYLTAWLLSLGVGIPASVLDTISLVVVTIILSYFTLVFGELVPKRIAMQKSMEMARLSCRVVSAIATIAKPVVKLLSLSTNGVLRLLRMRTDVEEEQVTEDEIRMMIDLGNESGSINEDEKELLHNVFDFSDQTVSDVMTHAADVESISVDATREEVLDTIRSTGLSRFPVYGEDESDILGVLNTRDFLVDWVSDGTKSVRDLMRPAYLVPESLSADDLLRDMQIKKIHLAVVLDEYGELAGVITVEDLLEEIVGNIYDEFDPAEPQELEQLGENLWRVSGSLSVEDLAEELDMELPEDEDYDTVGGMLLSCLRTIPEDGSRPLVQVHGLELQAEKVEDHRIRSVLVRKLPDDTEEQESA
ncbi:hemolysin family protein [Pseudoflavonifractor sp. An184]|uniref:hemolysin family protein n=1 Tax=Pseudoflavonifractor sp. An184 TaxID=1965576 RepID=UPI000B387FA8|nr:hemolysin family protein [Pseudoflavonifractor sp. An184]MBS5548919.1 HlyC/CorC family transporter [Oscillospiraceae bacterium]OUP55241.1 hemolysin [Pseudoflavonifractor sp. An184]